jgi:hypothetical protein
VLVRVAEELLWVSEFELEAAVVGAFAGKKLFSSAANPIETTMTTITPTAILPRYSDNFLVA